MKVIRTIQVDVLEAFDGPTEILTPQLVDEIMKPVRENKLRILAAALDIERDLVQIISHYFFGDDPINKERAGRFKALILTSDWCSLSVKRSLITQIINDTDALKGPEKNKYDSLLRKVLFARNAFAHGTVSTDGRKVKLAYFEGSPRSLFLDDEYFTGIEQAINECFSITYKIALATGASKIHESAE